MKFIPVYLVVLVLFFGRVTGFLNDATSMSPEKIRSQGLVVTSMPNPEDQGHSMPERMADTLDEFQITAELAERQVREGVLPVEDTNKLYFKMAEALDSIIEFMDEPSNVYAFLKVQGIDRIITPTIGINFLPLRSRILPMIKTLFDVAPTTTKAVVPFKVLDKLLDIFESDENQTMRDYAMEILSVWLPGTPSAQVRVMKLKGLESFYEQMIKMEPSKISSMLYLFNKIIREHMHVREKKRKTKADYEALRLYKQIGLVERMSLPPVCNGLLNLFEEVWLAREAYEDNLLPVLDLLQILKPHCHKVYKKQGKAYKLFEDMLVFIRDPTKLEFLDKMGMNATELDEFFTDFAEKVKPEPKEEL